MCTGGELALASIAAGSVLGAGAEKQAGEANANIEANNARIARQAANDALRRGAVDEQALKQRIGQIIGSQRAAYAGGGIALDSGTALAMSEDTARTGAIDVATIRLNAANEAWSYRQRAKAQDYQSKLSKKSGTQAALGSLLGGAGKFGGTYSELY